jgi:adenylyltransferase/sulfurtransferase
MLVPPLVEPGPPLTPAEVARWSRHLLLPEIGDLGQRRLRNAKVCVVGAGGLGAPALLYLAAAGVGRVGLVDSDVVELSNLQRQVVHATTDLGRPKVESAAERLAALAPEAEVVRHHVRLDEGNVDLLGDYDLVLDGTDSFATRYLVNDACVRLGLPEVWGSVLRFDAQVSVFWGAPPPGVPAVELRDLFPEPPPEGSVPSCAVAGVLGALCGQVGSVMATEAIKLITGAGSPALGRVLVLDALAARWSEVPLRPTRREAPAGAPSAPVAPAASPSPAAPVPGARVGPGVRDVGPAELAAALGQVTLLDVREPEERAIATLPDPVAVPLRALLDGSGLAAVPPGPLVVYCHHGVRSLHAARALLAAGWTDVAHLAGGIDAWSREVDPAVPRY